MEPHHTTREILYNGIELPEVWPPQNVNLQSSLPEKVPYLDNPPKVIPIDLGRQLFIDDFLIEKTSMSRTFHYPEKYAGNPVLFPNTSLEIGDGSYPAIACPKSGGVWYNHERGIFQMWYEAGWCQTICLAESADGINWIRPELDVFPGTNRVLPFGIHCDSWSVVPSFDNSNPNERYIMFVQEPCCDARAMIFTSPDGIHWGLPTSTGYTGDRSTMFYNPFRKKWCFSLRTGYGWETPGVEGMRVRAYAEGSDFRQAAQWGDARHAAERRAVDWVHLDQFDQPHPATSRKPQLYNLDAVAYESIMLGFFQIHHGPSNEECALTNTPKITELHFAYSRDGFHWSRPDRHAAIPASCRNVWDRGYVQSLGNLCTVSKDRITFYYCGFQGAEGTKYQGGMYHRGATGAAFLRRDGFVSMDAENEGELLSRPIQFSGNHLFVNLDAPHGELRVEIQTPEGETIAPWSFENCNPVQGDNTMAEVTWNTNADLAGLACRPLRLCFHLTHGKLYSFWVSSTAAGHSNGYLAGGSADYTGYQDL